MKTVAYETIHEKGARQGIGQQPPFPAHPSIGLLLSSPPANPCVQRERERCSQVALKLAPAVLPIARITFGALFPRAPQPFSRDRAMWAPPTAAGPDGQKSPTLAADYNHASHAPPKIPRGYGGGRGVRSGGMANNGAVDSYALEALFIPTLRAVGLGDGLARPPAGHPRQSPIPPLHEQEPRLL